MNLAPILLAQAAAPDPGFVLLLQMALIVGIFYLVWFRPVRQKQKRLEEQIKSMKAGDKVVLSSGIFGQIMGAEDDAFWVKVDEKTRLKVLKSAVAGFQAQPKEETEKK